MTIWIALILLCAIFGAIGLAKGAVRMAVSLFGIFLGLALAVPLSAPIRPLLASAGIKHPLWNAVFAPIIVFLLIWFVFIGIGFAIHHKLYMRYKYSADDLTRLRWERMNARVGAALGVLGGVTMLFGLGLLLYVLGYATLKISSDESNTGFVKFLSKAREDMRATGFDKSIAAIDPTSDRYYRGIDVFSLLYHNPQLRTRLNLYPGLLMTPEAKELNDTLAGDEGYRELIAGKGSAFQIANSPTTVSLVNSASLQEKFRQTDLADLENYLKTGKSENYAHLPILGSWTFDSLAALTDVRKKNPDLSAGEIGQLRDLLSQYTNAVLLVGAENKLALVGRLRPLNISGEAQIAQDVGEPAPESEAALEQTQEQAPISDQAALDARYGVTRTPAAPQAAGQQQQSQTIDMKAGLGQRIWADKFRVLLAAMIINGGTWEGERLRYRLTIPNVAGTSVRAPARIEGEELLIETPISTLVFYKSE